MTDFTKEFIAEARESITEPGVERYICIPVQLEMLDEIERLQSRIAKLENELEGKRVFTDTLFYDIYRLQSRIAELEAECDRAKAIVSRLRDFLFDYTNLKISNSQDDRWWALVDKFDELTTESEK